MKTRIVLAAASFSLLAAGQAFALDFAGEGATTPWPELAAPSVYTQRGTDFGAVLDYGDSQVTWEAFERAPYQPTTTAVAPNAVDIAKIGTDGQFPWPQLDFTPGRV